MLAVIVTAIATWLALAVVNALNISSSFLVEGSIAVVIGAAIGLIVPWWLMRRRRAARNA